MKKKLKLFWNFRRTNKLHNMKELQETMEFSERIKITEKVFEFLTRVEKVKDIMWWNDCISLVHGSDTVLYFDEILEIYKENDLQDWTWWKKKIK